MLNHFVPLLFAEIHDAYKIQCTWKTFQLPFSTWLLEPPRGGDKIIWTLITPSALGTTITPWECQGLGNLWIWLFELQVLWTDNPTDDCYGPGSHRSVSGKERRCSYFLLSMSALMQHMKLAWKTDRSGQVPGTIFPTFASCFFLAGITRKACPDIIRHTGAYRRGEALA